MPQPPRYERKTDFTTKPGSATDHVRLNAEFDGASQSINQLRARQALLLGDDDKLRKGVVTADAMSPDALGAFMQHSSANLSSAQNAANTAILAGAQADANRQSSEDARDAAIDARDEALEALEAAATSDASVLRSDLSAATGASISGYTPSGAGAVPTTVQAKLRQIVSVDDKGATGNGVILDSTDSTAAIALAESDTAVDGYYVPNGIYNTTEKRLTKRYYGPGSMRVGFVKAYETGNPLQLDPAWTGHNVYQVDRPVMVPPSVLKTSAASGVLKCVWLGDSISEGADAIYSNTMPQTVLDALRKQAPWLDFTLVNLSLSGFSMGSFADGVFAVPSAGAVGADTFYRSAFPHLDQIYGMGGMNRDDVWPTGATAGETWAWHVQQQAPDIVFVALGTNDPSEEDWLVSWNAAWADMQTWPKVPFIVMVPPAQPARSAYPEILPVINSVADCARAVAMANGFGLIDVNATSRLIADGVTTEYGQWLRERNFVNWADNTVWSPTPGTLTQTDTTPFYPAKVAFTGAESIATRLINARDIDVSASFTFGTADAIPFFNVRSPNSSTYTSGILVRLESNASVLAVYSNLTAVIGVPTGLSVPIGGSVRMRVRCVGGSLTVWVGYSGTPLLKNVSVLKSLAGYVSTGYNTGNGSVGRFELQYVPQEQMTPLSPAVVGDDQLFGSIPGGEIDARDDELYYGGDANHHPSSTASQLIYVPAVLRWVNEFIEWILRPHTIKAEQTAPQVNNSGDALEIPGTTVTVTPPAKSAHQGTQCRFDLSLPYINNDVVTGGASVALCTGPADGTQTPILAWYLEPLRGSFDKSVTFDLGPGTQQFSLQWIGTALSAGTYLSPISLSATLLT